MNEALTPYERRVAHAFEADGELGRAQAGFAERAGQREMALAVAAAIERGDSLVAEAGTGTGKTYAYLVPALLAGGRVLLSTGTKNLQDQLFRRDLPQVMRALGVAATVALLKGRSNYVCRYHLRRNLEEGRFERREDIAVLRRIDRFAAVSASGDRGEAPGIPEDAPAWAMATSTRDNCLGQDCPDLGACFVFRARQAAQQADVVVVNHHLFCADLALRDEGISELLPTTHALVFDEAHQLPEVATRFFGSSVSTRQVGEFARDLLRAGLAEARDAADWGGLSAALEQAVRVWRMNAGRPGRLDAVRLRAMDELLDAVERAGASVRDCGSALAQAAERGRELARLALRAHELAQRLDAWVAGIREPGAAREGRNREGGAAPDAPEARPDGDRVADIPAGPELDLGESILWLEAHASGVTLHATPLSVAPTFRRHREGAARAWIFTSATLSVAGRFDHFTSALGLDEAAARCWESPFDFPNQGLLYVPRGCGDPSAPGFAERVADACWPLIEANGGRAFVLCTSLRMVDRQAELLGERIRRAGGALELLVQGSATRSELLERFRRADAPVLVGSASFWEGVDVVGGQLSLVIIDKLPFAPPDDPVLQARVDALRRRGGDPFRAIQLPAAAMSLKQGAGRLIRSETDRGVLVICDERLLTKSYGNSLLRSLPPFRRSRSGDEALAWLGGASARPATSDGRPRPAPSA